MAQTGDAARIAQTQRTFQRVKDEIAAWAIAREQADPRGQHRTQLSTLRALFQAVLDRLEEQFSTLLEERPEGGRLYLDCRAFDRRVVWVGKAWEFFRVRFDQRDNEAARPMLTAADEVVWSCFAPVLQAARDAQNGADPNRGVLAAPAPLPCLEADALPSAFPSAVVAEELRGWLPGSKMDVKRTELLAEILRNLPVPIVRMPSVAVHSPWLLVLLAHEVGHHVQYALRTNLVADFKTGLGFAAAKVAPDQKTQWTAWATEVFADVFSVLAVGPMAGRALADVIACPAAQMTKEEANYPSPAARLLVMKAVAEATGFQVGYLPGLECVNPTPHTNFRVIEAVVEYALGPLPGVGETLPDLLTVDPSDFSVTGTSDLIAQVQTDNPTPAKQPKTARLLAGAAYEAWLANSSDGPQEVDKLSARICTAIAASAPEGVRSIGPQIESLEERIATAALELTELSPSNPDAIV